MTERTKMNNFILYEYEVFIPSSGKVYLYPTLYITVKNISLQTAQLSFRAYRSFIGNLLWYYTLPYCITYFGRI